MGQTMVLRLILGDPERGATSTDAQALHREAVQAMKNSSALFNALLFRKSTLAFAPTKEHKILFHVVTQTERNLVHDLPG